LTSGDARFLLNYQGRSVRLSPTGTVRTGAGEDSRVYVSLQDFQAWTGLGPSVVEIAASGTAGDVTSLLQQLQLALPNADVHAVRQVTEGEANVLGKTRSTLLSSSAFIVCTAALCVLATLMGWVFDRRRDFAIMKALGASDLLIALFVGRGVGTGIRGSCLRICGREWNCDVDWAGEFSCAGDAAAERLSGGTGGMRPGHTAGNVTAFAIVAGHSARYDFEGRVDDPAGTCQQVLSGEDGGRRRRDSSTR
jgi:hypothetical protein